MNDRLGRPLRNLRLSVTDRCNLRCEYCMPEDDYVWLPREDVLRFEEISALVDVFLSLGVDKVRLTGGEPLLRRDVHALVRMIAVKPGLKDLALTTNGVLLADQVDDLRAAGLGRITVSLDTLHRDRFARLTRFDQLEAVHAGIAAARRVFGTLKIDSVVIRGVNDDELADLIEYGKSVNGEVRFIEYMDVGRRLALGARTGGLEARDAGPADRALRADRADGQRRIGAGRALHARRRHRVRHHFVDDRALLPHLRSQPADRRRHVVPLPVRDAGHRSPRAAAARRVSR